MSKLAITVGDPSGIGVILAKKWILANENRLDKVCFIGHKKWLDELKKITNNKIFVEEVGKEDFSPELGKPTIEGAYIAYEALKHSAKGCIDSKYWAVCTLPVSKEMMSKVDPSFVGQTEFFASAWQANAVMGFAGEKLNVVLATWHIPYSKVPEQIKNTNCLENAVEQTVFLLEKLNKKGGKIAICGINPHAGENGLLGREEIEIINPKIKHLIETKNYNISYAIPADTAFYRHLKGEFAAVIALQHDQGLAPLKLIEFNSAVNISLGLKFIRTSPDHGTAFELAKLAQDDFSLADENSFSQAVNLAFKTH